MIPITKPFFGPEEAKAIQEPLETGWIVQGPYVKRFEEKFSQYGGNPFSVATSSCTTALHIAVAILGLKPGDEVIVPAFTWISTANVVEYMGAKAVFCDIDLATFNIDPKKIEEKITDRTVGIIPVHLFGLSAEMPAILEIAEKHGLWTVEDAACAFGAFLHGRHAGTWGHMGAFSFHPRKSITTGEGGMITTSNPEYDSLARSLRDHGASRSDFARHGEKAGFLLAEYKHLGYNYRMTDIQGALGCVQMDRAEWILNRRREIAAVYDERLARHPGITTPRVPPGHLHGYQSYVCFYSADAPIPRNDLMAKLEAKGIATRQGTHAPVLLDYYREKYHLREEDYPNAVAADRQSLSLPLFATMTPEEQEAVCSALEQA